MANSINLLKFISTNLFLNSIFSILGANCCTKSPLFTSKNSSIFKSSINSFKKLESVKLSPFRINLLIIAHKKEFLLLLLIPSLKTMLFKPGIK